MSYSDIVDKVSVDLPLFESESDRDAFLKNAVRTIKQALEADMAAVFIYNHGEENLSFRAGVDGDGVWDRFNCPGNPDGSEPFRFEAHLSDVDRAFTEGRVIKLTYKAENPQHPFQSKLIIPVARGPVRIGVLVLADRDAQAFDDIDEGEILAAITHLGDLLEDASALITDRPKIKSDESRTIHGRRAGGGIALGAAFPFGADMDLAAAAVVPLDSPKDEVKRFDTALERSIHQLERIRGKAEAGMSETGALIFMAQVLMLRDEALTGSMRDLIQEGTPAATAVRSLVNEYADRFSAMNERRLAEKAQDVRDLGYRLMTNLAAGGDTDFSYADRITLAKHIYPSDLFRLSLEGVSGVVLMGTAVTAHISILARSLGLPVLITDDKSLLDIEEGTRLILDAGAGRIHVNPTQKSEAEYRRRLITVGDAPKAYTLHGRTADGVSVGVFANINILKDAEDARSQGAEGIGLYRSEFPFILKNDILSEEQQYQIYRPIAATQRGNPITFRTADIGGDKILQGREEPEENPFLGVRGIRFSLAHREMFRDQLRAMLRAGAENDLGIMFPMVSGVEEIIEAKAELERCKDDLIKRGVPFNDSPRLGAMVELPSAALAARELAEETDFLSIGTNDLTMYLLAVDRTNEALSHLYLSHHPTVLRTMASIVKDAGDGGTEVSVCGDAAEDPTLTPFLVGIGIRKLSVPPSEVESLKQRLAAFTLDEAERIAEEMLAIGRVGELEQWLNHFRQNYAPV